LPLTVGLIIWYGVSFYPNLKKLELISNRGNETVLDVKDKFYAYAVIAESERNIRLYAMRQAYWSLVFNEVKGSTIIWHSGNTLWLLASYIHFDKSEIFGIWVDCSIYGCGKGLNVAANKYYKKNIPFLNKKELAGLAALVKSPEKYKPGSKNSEEKIMEILAK